ncbi:MAG: radical SAM protein, partial [Thermoanaerobaculia bacterium]
MLALSERTPLHVPPLHLFRDGEVTYAVDGDAPNWVALDARGAAIVRTIVERKPTFGALVAAYAAEQQLEAGKAWLHVHDFLTALARASLLADAPVDREPYRGRAAYVGPEGLRELWLQINNACNLACTHCLVSSGPDGDPGMETAKILNVLDGARALGLERVYVTGGEPLLRKDLFDIARHATGTLGCELIVLTNATVVAGRVRRELETLDRDMVRFQVSVDGARPETNDPIRGAGTFARALDGGRALAGLGFDVSLTTVTTEHNLDELPELAGIARSIGA